MARINLSAATIAAVITVTILQGCAATKSPAGAQCVKPTLAPPDASNLITSVTVKIATVTKGAYLRYTLDGSTPTGGSSGNGTEISAATGEVPITFGVGPIGTILKAIAFKNGMADSPVATGTYVYQSPHGD
jgi:hypothetical protein